MARKPGFMNARGLQNPKTRHIPGRLSGFWRHHNCDPSRFLEHPAQKLWRMDGKTTWWTPYPNRNGKNSWIRLDFPHEKWFAAIEIIPGSHHIHYKSIGNLWYTNNRMKKGELVFSSGFRFIIHTVDEDRLQRIEFNPVKTKSITLYPIEWKSGTHWNDLCISRFMPVEAIPESTKTHLE